MENQRYALPDLSSTTPTDFQLLEEHLRPNLERYMSERMMNLPGGVNDGLPHMDPWELPGMPPDNELEEWKKEVVELIREKYFLTDCLDLLHAINRSLSAPQGFWQEHSLGCGIRDESNPSRFAGMMRTYYFHTGYPSGGVTKTNWVMNVYFLVGQNCHIQDKVALCHVFENNSPDYGKGSLSSTNHFFGPYSYQRSGKPCNKAIHGPSSSSSLSTHPVSDQTSHPGLTSYIEEYKKLLDEPDTSTDTGIYDARGDGPDILERFTKIFAHDQTSYQELCSSSSLSTHPVSDQTLQPESTSYQELCSSSSLSTHPVSDQTSHPELTSYIGGLKNLLLEEPDTSTDTGSYNARGGGICSAVIASGESGQPRKRTRTSSVWERFTKMFACGPDRVMVTFAVCNHCCKVLTGDSKNGTSHLARHKCQCKLCNH